MHDRALPAELWRGGTSKGLLFLAADLPADPARRDACLLAAMGSPDPRQIDGVGGAHPLTSKVGVVAPATRPDCHVDYLFLQVPVAGDAVSTAQNCGNILAAIGPFAIEHGFAVATGATTAVRVHMVNSGGVAIVEVPTPDGTPALFGRDRIDGVPGTAAAIAITFEDIAGGSCGALLPTGNATDMIEGVAVTLIDNGMPVVVMRAADFGLSGSEPPAEIEADAALCARIEAIRLAAGPAMRLGDVADTSVPKLILVGPAEHGGSFATRSFIPHRVHDAIGVFAAVSVATAAALPGSVLAGLFPPTNRYEIEHPTGYLSVAMTTTGAGQDFRVGRAALIRTARRLMRGEVYVSSAAWPS